MEKEPIKGKSIVDQFETSKENHRQAIKVSEERFERMISEVEDYAIILLDVDGSIMSWNKGAERIKGYKSEEIIGKSFQLFYTREDKDRGVPDQLIKTAFDTGKATHEGWRLKQGGARFWGFVTLTAIHDTDGQVVGLLKVTRDLTERKIAEDKLSSYTEQLQLKNEELRKSEERFQKMIAEVQDYAILVLDKEGIIQNWNSGAQILKGYSAPEIIGKSFENFYSPEDIAQGLPARLLKEAELNGKASTEGWRVRRDGTNFWASVVITGLHNEAGDLIGFSKVTRDLSDRKRAEDQAKAYASELEDKNRVLEALNAELSSFAYIVSHDLKEPIRKIRIFSGRQREPNKSPEQILNFSEKIEESAARMQKLMEDLLTYSELSMQSVPEEIDFNEILQRVKNDLEIPITEKEANIESSKLPVISGIPHQMHQLFLNLVSNALKFSKPDQKPQLKIISDETSGSEISDELRDKFYFRIRFIDNGIGFSPEYAKKIFEVFQRLQPKHESTGSGVGLAIVKKIMHNHAGFVIAESEVDKGATFKLYFPKP
jgi:PAS domain S-box-containing protein